MSKNRIFLCSLLSIVFTFPLCLLGQPIPSRAENIDYLVTFSKGSEPKWGDDDHSQVFFFTIPEEYKSPFYIRIYDPDIGGNIDQANNEFNSETVFAVYGGEGAFSSKDAKNVDPIGNYKSGTLLKKKTFGVDPDWDGKWYALGPFNPLEGEWSEPLKARVFKLVADGGKGDDGNLYRYFLSARENSNREIEGANGFTYEYSFRLKDEVGGVAHLYPFADERLVSIIQHNFDFDQDGDIKLFSVAKNGHSVRLSNEGNWTRSTHQIEEAEKGKSLNIRIIKRAKFANDMVLYITNQYNEPVPFFASPIGGPPKYNYRIKVSYSNQ